ncbi:Mis18-binding protein 1 [Oryzias melastigma]|uniref:Mis18-binding protein 1 n=1 Tax=Oryzias melastigma TaxID=30732 RepID=A0A834FF77_ORYME|nr:Mis18-binding protein 1 [Oryzias melastigma]
MFAFMKKKEHKTQKLEAHISNSRRDLFGNLHQTEDIPLPAAENHVNDAPERCTPAQESDRNTSDSQSDSSRSACPPRTSTSPAACFTGGPTGSQLPTNLHSEKENVIYLKKWMVMRSSNGLFVDGIHREDNIQWHSNIIVERLSKSMLKTVSGRVYVLEGDMLTNVASDFPKWFLQKFANGFPADWKKLYEKFLSESKE